MEPLPLGPGSGPFSVAHGASCWLIQTENALLCLPSSGGQTDGQQLALRGRQPSSTQAWRSGPARRTTGCCVGSRLGCRGKEGRAEGAGRPRGWDRMEEKGPEGPKSREGGGPAACPALPGPRPAERWVWAGPRWRGRPAGSEPQARIVRLSHFLWLYCLCPAPYCLASFCPPFSARCLLFPSLPGCFHFFCLKFLRGRFYFQRFD